jgi:hypothetical protein
MYIHRPSVAREGVLTCACLALAAARRPWPVCYIVFSMVGDWCWVVVIEIDVTSFFCNVWSRLTWVVVIGSVVFVDHLFWVFD